MTNWFVISTFPDLHMAMRADLVFSTWTQKKIGAKELIRREKTTVPGGTEYLVPGTRYRVPSAWYQVPGAWHQAPGTRYQAPGKRFQTPGTWYQEYGTWYLVPGTWHLVPGTGCSLQLLQLEHTQQML